MKNLLRLLRYGLAYSLEWLPGVLLLAMVGVLDTFRTLLFQPIFDQVLRPDAPEGPILLGLRNSKWHFDLRSVFPHSMHVHNAWDVVAYALIISTLLKGLCDYLGTYLVNYAGFGMITDLRNHLYEATMRRSSSFFHKHATGTILSTLINDVDKVQFALSSVIGYDKASQVAHYALDHDLTLKEGALQLGAVSAADFDRIVDPRKMVKPYVPAAK